MKLRRTLLFTASASSLLVACQLILGIEDDRFTFTPDGGAGSDAEGDAGPQDRCQHVFPPGPPSSADPDDRERLVFAMNRATLRSIDDGGATAGYDLDNGCTCNPLDTHGGVRSCTPPDASDPLCDGDGGVDNAVGAIVEEILKLATINPEANFDGELTRQATCGAQAVLVELTKYNGLANDPDVLVRIVPSFGIREGDPDAQGVTGPDCPVQVGGFPLRPRGDIGDKWSTPDGGLREYDEQAGWVSDFQLVVDGRRTNQALIAALGSGTLKLETATFTARIVPLDADGRELPIQDGKIQSPSGFAHHYRLDKAVLAGRAKTDDILSAIGHTKVGGASKDGGSDYFCKNATLNELARFYVCGAADSVIPSRQDFTGVACNAMSIVFQFSANQADIGTVQHSPSGDECDPSYRGTCN